MEENLDYGEYEEYYDEHNNRVVDNNDYYEWYYDKHNNKVVDNNNYYE